MHLFRKEYEGYGDRVVRHAQEECIKPADVIHYQQLLELVPSDQADASARLEDLRRVLEPPPSHIEDTGYVPDQATPARRGARHPNLPVACSTSFTGNVRVGNGRLVRFINGREVN